MKGVHFATISLILLLVFSCNKGKKTFYNNGELHERYFPCHNGSTCYEEYDSTGVRLRKAIEDKQKKYVKEEWYKEDGSLSETIEYMDGQRHRKRVYYRDENGEEGFEIYYNGKVIEQKFYSNSDLVFVKRGNKRISFYENGLVHWYLHSGKMIVFDQQGNMNFSHRLDYLDRFDSLLFDKDYPGWKVQAKFYEKNLIAGKVVFKSPLVSVGE